MKQLPATWELPQEIRERFGERGPGRQRAMTAQGHLLLVLHHAPTQGRNTRDGVFFWRRPDGTWEASSGSDGLLRLRKHLGQYDAAEETNSQAYDLARDAEDYFQILERVAPLHHAAQNLHATLQAAREAIPDDRDIIGLRDEAYDLERTLDLLYADTKNGLDYSIAKMAEEETALSMQSLRVANRLNTLAAIFFPLTAVASLFGMNLHSGLEYAPSSLFWVVSLISIVLGFAIRGWIEGEAPGWWKRLLGVVES